MQRRPLSPVRAWSAAGLLSIVAPLTGLAQEPSEPVPSASAKAETVSVLDAKKAGTLAVDVRGHGQSQVRMVLKNTSERRLNVVLPPGLVAASATGQAPGGGAGGGGGGLQSMGLGQAGNAPGAFGKFQGDNNANAPGFRSMGFDIEQTVPPLTIPAGQAVTIDVPSVCLNFGLPSPGAKDKLTLVDIDDYSRDPRVRKALRSLATLGTSQGTAQAVMWNVSNNVPFATMLEQGEKVANRYEVALASRFVEALDASSGSDRVDAAYLSESRVFVTILDKNGLGKDARRLASEIEGLRVLGLPVRTAVASELPKASGPALHLLVDVNKGKGGETVGKVRVHHHSGLSAAVGTSDASDWSTLGQASFRDDAGPTELKGLDLARDLDRAVASAFVVARPARKAIGDTAMRIENRLPFSLASVTLRAGTTSGAPPVTFRGLGIGPARSGVAVIEAPHGVVDRVELNGL
jgi:hypothetical protein